jgi:ABC-type microcin C transport system duplicated ATPase subunit YejF
VVGVGLRQDDDGGWCSFEEPTGGSSFRAEELGAWRRNLATTPSVQAVFQDPFASLNPRMRVDIIEPLITHGASRRRVASGCGA